jgi:hypothetical protein
MKARPRRIENRIAEELNKYFSFYRLSHIERIPVLGREGPDYTKNELGLNLDAKSRKANPKSHKLHKGELSFYAPGTTYIPDPYQDWHDEDFDGYVGMKMMSLNRVLGHDGPYPYNKIIRPSAVVLKWLDKMDPLGGLILHWPNTPVKNSVLIARWKTIEHIQETIWPKPL